MNIKKDGPNLLIALLMYLPTLAFMPAWLYLFLIPISIYLNIDFLKSYFTQIFKFKIKDKTFTLLLVFAFIAFIFRLIDYPKWESIKDFYSFAYLFPFTYVVGRTVAKRTGIYKYIIYFIAIESFFCVLEYSFGVSTFFTSLKLFRPFESYDMLYYTRVFGLSANSSVLTLKFIFGIILLSKVNWSERNKQLFELLFLTVSIVTFGRIAIIAIFVYYFIKIFDSIIVSKTFSWKNNISFFLFFLFFAVNPIWTKNQFTRNNMKVSTHSTFEKEEIEEENIVEIDMSLLEELGLANVNMSGRSHIWTAYGAYGYKYYIMGNKGKKFMLGHVHAHNSYLEIFASFGVFMLIFLVSIFAFSINKSNYVIALSILVLAFGQYLIFWGISFFDIIFYSLLFFKQPNLLDEK